MNYFIRYDCMANLFVAVCSLTDISVVSDVDRDVVETLMFFLGYEEIDN